VSAAAALLIAAPAAAQGVSPSDDAHEAAARSRFDHGVALMLEHRWADAIVEFEAARASRTTAPLLYNLGLAHRALGHYAAAIEAFTAFVAQAGNALPAERSRELQGYLAEMGSHVARVDVVAEPPNATVSVDDAAPAPPAPLVLDPGHHLLRFTAPMHASADVPLDRGQPHAGRDPAASHRRTSARAR
jgi:hypothetical protein